jgi:hypothetical protein
MSSLDLTKDWLQTVLRPYPSRERIIPEVLGVLTQWRTLAVKTDAFSEHFRLPPKPKISHILVLISRRK